MVAVLCGLIGTVNVPEPKNFPTWPSILFAGLGVFGAALAGIRDFSICEENGAIVGTSLGCETRTPSRCTHTSVRNSGSGIDAPV